MRLERGSDELGGHTFPGCVVHVLIFQTGDFDSVTNSIGHVENEAWLANHFLDADTQLLVEDLS